MFCKICQYLAGSSSILSRHVKKAHGLSPKEYFDKFADPITIKCPFCDKEKKWANGKYQGTCGDKECYKQLKHKTNLEKYGQMFFNNRVKYKKTCLEKFGVDVASKADSVKNKMKETSIKRYGTTSPLCNNEVKQKTKNTLLAKYGTTNIQSCTEIIETKRKNCIKKYGVEHHMKTEQSKKAMAETNILKYGCSCSLHNDEINKKTLKTWNEKYNANNPLSNAEIRNKISKTKLERYGTEKYNNRNKCKQTCIDKYGVEYVTQTEWFNKNKKHKFDYDGLSFDSQDELKFYKYCKGLGLSVKYQPCSFNYTDSLKRTHTYFPDFGVGGKLYEVKGDHLWKDHHVWFPYRNTLNEQQLKEIDARDLAKTECMRANNVTVILSSDIDKLDEIIH